MSAIGRMVTSVIETSANPLRKPAEPSARPLLRVAAAALGAAAGAGWLLQRSWRSPADPRQRAAQALGAGAAVLCLSVALDSGLEHYRGMFKNRLMYVAPSVALLGAAAAIFVAASPQRATTKPVRVVFGAIGVTGAVGFGFHIYNILKRPGGLDFVNLFYAAPAGAPFALALGGLYGELGRRFIEGGTGAATASLSKITAGVIAGSLLGTSAEAGLLHFRGAFQNPAMYAPVIIPPIAAVSLAVAVLSPRRAAIAEPLLKTTAVLGIAGPLLHAYGIHRNMGGWRNWSQMILQGPPLPAPPAFLGIAVAGIGVLPLLGDAKR
jgi:hypothetical protein